MKPTTLTIWMVAFLMIAGTVQAPVYAQTADEEVGVAGVTTVPLLPPVNCKILRGTRTHLTSLIARKQGEQERLERSLDSVTLDIAKLQVNYQKASLRERRIINRNLKRLSDQIAPLQSKILEIKQEIVHVKMDLQKIIGLMKLLC